MTISIPALNGRPFVPISPDTPARRPFQKKVGSDSTRRRKIMLVYGTRPEAIKMAPLIAPIRRSAHLVPVVVVTGQHRQMLDQVNSLFGIDPDSDLDIIAERQTLESVTCKVLNGVSQVMSAVSPDMVVVQGDTTTCFAASLAAFYRKVPVAHLEAGLRTGNTYDPFPEEINRRLTTQLAALHLAPTATARDNLLADNVPADRIHISGNTVIDALLNIAARDLPSENPMLSGIAGRRCVLVTAHRRESWGEPMANIGRAVARLAERFPDITFILPAHLNPVVRESLLPPLSGRTNVVVTEPLGYADFCQAMALAEIVITDSGGVQEEAPSLGKPVLVMRETTERPEAVTAGTVKLVGTDENHIVAAASRLLTEPSARAAMARAVNPYGDGQAAGRVVASIEHFFGRVGRPADFNPQREPRRSPASIPAAARVVDDLAVEAGMAT